MKDLDELQKDPRFEEAQQHVRSLRGFYTHALVYILVNGGLFAINLATNPNRWWFGFATVGWGIGLVAHGASVFVARGWLGAQWEERKIRDYLQRRG